MLKDKLKHLYFWVGNNLSRDNIGVKFIYAHYWNKNSVPKKNQVKSIKEYFQILLNEGWRFLHCSDLDAVKKNEKCILLSFDDGFKDVTEIWHEIALKLNIKYTIFINPGFVNAVSDKTDLTIYNSRYNNSTHYSNTWNELEIINNSMICDIQSHGYSHKRFVDLEWNEFIDEILLAEELIKKKLNKKVTAIAWPYGRYEDIQNKQIEFLSKRYEFLFSAHRSKYIYSDSVINRDHFELSWPISSINYLLRRKRI